MRLQIPVSVAFLFESGRMVVVCFLDERAQHANLVGHLEKIGFSWRFQFQFQLHFYLLVGGWWLVPAFWMRERSTLIG
jgi:hypothetical protein